MGDYDMIFRVDVDAPREAVVTALTTESGIKGWWTDRASVPQHVGDTLEFTFPGMPLPFDMELVESTDARVVWRSRTFPPPWVGTRVAWRLGDNPDGPGTRVDMRHGGWEADNDVIGI